ncbi:tRNA (adenosine(37)-N6)-threonylcarbamoyltransferase complex dimerization subunit type 1 TsaB [Pseudomonas sp. Marseille-QA0892]
MTVLLALDTATEACSVALKKGDHVLSRYDVIPRMHAQRLLPMVQELLSEAGLVAADIDAIAFGRGPGAFTGVRIAIGIVQGLAYALDRPVVPISDLALIAQRAYRENACERVAVAIDARMDEVYWGCYANVAGEMQLQGAEAVLPPERVELPRDFAGAWHGGGTGWGYGARIPLTPASVFPDLLPHAEDLITLASFALARGETVSAEAAQPIYLRDNVATPKKT